MSQHTPGPLVEQGITGDGIERNGCEVCGFIAIGQPDQPVTAYVAHRADANLYRAAPELLEALKEAAIWYGGENHSYECRSNDNADLCDCGVHAMDERINRAIAKAEGRP